MSSADVLVVGAGIAGASAAYFAALRGRRVTLCDSGRDRASQVPTALINPVRGYRARVSAEDLEGARLTLDLIERLKTAGHSIRGGRGIFRPVPDDEHEAEWRAQLPPEVPHEWLGAEVLSSLKGNWTRVLYLPEAGWVETAGFLSALIEESRAERVHADVSSIDPERSTATLASGDSITAQSLVWCAGAAGAAHLNWPARYRPGSVATLKESWIGPPASFGLYFAANGEGSVGGPTTEGELAHYERAFDPIAIADAEAELIERIREARGSATLETMWRGVRLESVTPPLGLAVLGPFGSRGYLRAPAAARRWASALPAPL